MSTAAQRAGTHLAREWEQITEAYARGGAQAVAERACPNGSTEEKAAIAAQVERRMAEAAGHAA
jgi:hypothetical protein